MKFRPRKVMAVGRGHSLSSEKRAQDQYPAQYPCMVHTGPGRVGGIAEEDDRFNDWLIAEQRARDAGDFPPDWERWRKAWNARHGYADDPLGDEAEEEMAAI